MYEYKIFECAESYSLKAMNALLTEISQKSWEPIKIDFDKGQILAKRPKVLND